MSNYQKLVDYFIETDELGHHNPSGFSICLYDYECTEKKLRELTENIGKITKNYKLVVTNSHQKLSNISILDIDL